MALRDIPYYLLDYQMDWQYSLYKFFNKSKLTKGLELGCLIVGFMLVLLGALLTQGLTFKVLFTFAAILIVPSYASHSPLVLTLFYSSFFPLAWILS